MTESLTEDIGAELSTMLDRLAPDETNPDAVEQVLGEAQARLPWPKIHTGLLERVEQFDTARDRMALVLHATDPDVASAGAGKRALDGVFEVLVAAADQTGMDTYLTRGLSLLENTPALHGDLPTVLRLIEIANEIEGDHEDTAERVISLAQRLEDIMEEVDA